MSLIIAYVGKKGCVMAGDKRRIAYFGSKEERELLEPRQLPEGGVKHIPVITKEDGKIVVTMGEVEHPMVEEHYINFVELIVGDQVYRANLKPGDEPKAVFDVNAEVEDVKAIEYCNIHGLWHS